MAALVVFAHPKPDAFAGDLLGAVVGGLAEAGHDVDVVDLYREGFDATLSAEEWRAYPGSESVLAPSLARYAEKLRGADVLAFVFPMWWSGPPSMLKGFFDRALAPGVAFHLADDGRVSPGLRNIRRIIVATAAEPPGYFSHRSTRHLAHKFARSLRRSTGWTTRVTVAWAGPGDAGDPDKQRRFLDHTRGVVARLQ